MTTEEKNRLIAEFMGFQKVCVGYSGCREGHQDDETDWQVDNEKWMSKMGIEQVGEYIVDVPNDLVHEWDTVRYHESWDWLMPVVERIQHSGCLVDIHIYSDTTCRIQKPLKVPPSFSVQGRGKTPIEAAYNAIVEFITWYNATKTTTNEQ